MTTIPLTRKVAACIGLWLVLLLILGFQTHTFPALDTNNTFTGSNTYQGPEIYNGTVAGSQTGLYATAGQQPYTFLLNGISPVSEYHTVNVNGAINTTSGFTAGMNVPASATVFQADGLETYVTCATIAVNCVGAYFSARPTVNGHLSVWGINPIVTDVGFTGTNLAGIEVDTNVTSATSSVQSIQLNGSFTAQPASALGVRCTLLQGTGKWTGCFSTDAGASTGIAFSMGALCITTSCASQTLTGFGLDSGGVARSGFMQVSQNGDWQLEPLSGRGVGIAAGSILTPRGVVEVSTGGTVPDALNVNLAKNFNLTDGGNTGLSMGFSDSGTLRGFVQARNTVGANNTAYPLTLNELGGNVGIGNNNPGVALDVTGTIRSSAGYQLGTVPYILSTAPTIAAAGCGGAAASIVVSNGTAAFKVNVGTTPTSACTITMPSATTGWNCSATDITTNSTSVFLQKQSGAESQTAITITNYSDVAVATAFVASDILKVQCSAD